MNECNKRENGEQLVEINAQFKYQLARDPNKSIKFQFPKLVSRQKRELQLRHRKRKVYERKKRNEKRIRKTTSLKIKQNK